MGMLALGVIAVAIGEGIVGSLIASGILKAGGKLWGFGEEQLRERITGAARVAINHFAAPFTRGTYFTGGEVLEAFFGSTTMEQELAKIVRTDNESPNVNTLYQAFLEAGDTNKLFPGFDLDSFKNSMMTSIDKFRGELADVIQRRRNEEEGHKDLYLQQVAEHCGRLDFVGIPDTRSRDLRLEDIFITLRAREQIPEADVLLEKREEDKEEEDESEDMERRREREEAGAREAPPVKLNDALRENSKVVILGRPGSGKTTMLRYVALMLAEGQAKKELGLSDDPIPIFLELSRFTNRDDQNESLVDFMYDYVRDTLNLSPPPNFFENFLDQGRCIVLLDGLDEVATLAQRVEARDIVSLLASGYSGNTFVVTSRIAGYNEAILSSDFQHFTVYDFTEEDVAEFAQKWYRAREGDTEVARGKADDLVEAIKTSPRVVTLARNPLMLTIIALIHRVEAELPNQRIKLYDKCTESLLDKWETVKRRGERFMTEEDKRRRLEWIAYWMHNMPGEVGREKTVRRGELQQRLTELLVEKGRVADLDEAETEAKLFLDHIRRRAGVLIEQGRGLYSFVHLTFQEYFTACDMHSRLLAAAMNMKIDSFFDEELKPRLHDPRWHEVILLLVGKLNEVSEEAAAGMVERILDADSQYEKILHRDLLLAGRCLADDVAVDEVAKGQILGQILDLSLRGKYSSLRSLANEVLTAMRGSSYEEEIRNTLMKAMAEDDSGIVRYCAADALGKLGTASEDVIQTLMKAMAEDDSYTVRAGAASALHNLGREPEDMIQALMKAMEEDDSHTVRYRAASTLGNLRTASEDVIQTLMKAMAEDDSYTVRYRAASALGNLRTASEDVIQALMKAMAEDDSYTVRSRAASALGNLRTASEDVIQALMKAMADDSDTVRSRAASALGDLRTASEDVIQALMKAMADDSDTVRSRAASALGNLRTASENVIQALMKAMADDSDSVRSRAADALGNLRTASEDVIQALMKAMADDSDSVRSRAADALGNLGTASEDVIQALMKAMAEDDSDTARSRAADALGDLRTASEDVIQALMKAMADDSDTVRYRAADALGNLGTASEDVIQALMKAMAEDDSYTARFSAASALGNLGGGRSDVMNALVGRLEIEQDLSVGNAIFDAISTLAAAEAGQ